MVINMHSRKTLQAAALFTIAMNSCIHSLHAIIFSPHNLHHPNLRLKSPLSRWTYHSRPRQRYPILSSMATQYTINDDVCPPLDESELRVIVQKHCKHLDTFLQNKPIAKHTQAAFDQIYPHVDASKNIILDSGCGTGRSTLILGEKYPNHTVIGIDRSFVRSVVRLFVHSVA